MLIVFFHSWAQIHTHTHTHTHAHTYNNQPTTRHLFCHQYKLFNLVFIGFYWNTRTHARTYTYVCSEYIVFVCHGANVEHGNEYSKKKQSTTYVHGLRSSRRTNDNNIIDNCYGAIKMGILEFRTLCEFVSVHRGFDDLLLLLFLYFRWCYLLMLVECGGLHLNSDQII